MGSTSCRWRAATRSAWSPTGAPRAIATGLYRPCCLAADDDDVYWFETNENNTPLESATWRILRMPRGGGATEVFARDASRVSAIAFDTTYVYWSTYVAPDRQGDIRRKPKRPIAAP